MRSDAEKSLLEEESSSFLDEAPIARPKPKRVWKTQLIFIHLTLIALYTIGSILVIRHWTGDIRAKNSSISSLTLNYHTQAFQNLSGNPFAGPPSTEIDNAWDDLLSTIHLRVSKAELDRNGQTSVGLPGGGYLAWLGSHHLLHCLMIIFFNAQRMVRQWNYRGHYHPNITVEEAAHLEMHADHCFETLRQAVMCHADLSLTTFNWNETTPKPMFTVGGSIHTCVDWTDLQDSLADRLVSDDEVSSLVNPIWNAGG
ncbi:hypothetical protein MMC25_004990 [Agyrium rufum]|nr:hypothetical protein [Agyrium rufum]